MIDVTAMQFLLVQNRHQTHDWTGPWLDQAEMKSAYKCVIGFMLPRINKFLKCKML